MAKAWRLSRHATPDLGDLSCNSVFQPGQVMGGFETGLPFFPFFVIFLVWGNKSLRNREWDVPRNGINR